MYAIVSNGALAALCEKPRYVKRHERTGVYVVTDEGDAIGLSVCGTLYNINGQEAIEGAPQAIVLQGDISEYVFRNRARIAENEEATGTAIIEIEDALCDLDTASEEKMAVMEDALCELDSKVNGGGTDE